MARSRTPSLPVGAEAGSAGVTGREALPAAVVGVLAGIAPQLDGLYAIGQWGPVGLVALLGSLVCLVATRGSLHRTGMMVLIGLAGWAVVDITSTLWAEDGYQARLEGFRTVTYAAVFALLLVLVRRGGASRFLLGGYAAGIALLGAVDVIRLLADDGGVFLIGRLDEPVGYANGLAAACAMGAWPWLALATTSRRVLAAGAGAMTGSALISLVLLCQSRGAALALPVSIVVVVVLAPGRVRTLGVVGLIAVGAVIAYPTLSDVYDTVTPATGLPAHGAIRDAGLVLVIVAMTVGVLAAGWSALALRFEERLPSSRGLRVPIIVAGVLLAVAVGVAAGPASGRVSAQWKDFKALQPITPTSRLTSPGGNRYDYWRVAVKQFRSEPLRGVGAGNYDRTYFADRRTTEDVRQPHSLPLQVLSESGVLGLAFLILAFGGLVWAAVTAARRGASRGVLTASLGVAAVWMAHTSVDWLHLLPGVTFGALLAGSALISLTPQAPPRRLGGRSGARPLAFAVATVAAAQLAALVLATHRADAARAALETRPAAAIGDARGAIKLDHELISAYVTLAAAEARTGDYDNARKTLLAARGRKPHDPVLPALLGDLATRRGDKALAAAAYREASRLDPRNTEFREAARAAARRTR